jgi:hypothetical protein
VQFFLSWPWSRAARVVAGWQSWAPFQPDALWSNLHLSAAQRGGTPVIQVGGTSWAVSPGASGCSAGCTRRSAPGRSTRTTCSCPPTGTRC